MPKFCCFEKLPVVYDTEPIPFRYRVLYRASSGICLPDKGLPKLKGLCQYQGDWTDSWVNFFCLSLWEIIDLKKKLLTLSVTYILFLIFEIDIYETPVGRQRKEKKALRHMKYAISIIIYDEDTYSTYVMSYRHLHNDAPCLPRYVFTYHKNVMYHDHDTYLWYDASVCTNRHLSLPTPWRPLGKTRYDTHLYIYYRSITYGCYAVHR